MKTISIFCLCFSFSISAAMNYSGKLVIKRADGSFLDQTINLEVPDDLAGVYRLHRGADAALESHSTQVSIEHGRTFFKVVFIDPHGTGQKLAMKFVGTYLTGANVRYFHGTVYSGFFRDMDHPCEPDSNGVPQCPRPRYQPTGFFALQAKT